MLCWPQHAQGSSPPCRLTAAHPHIGKRTCFEVPGSSDPERVACLLAGGVLKVSVACPLCLAPHTDDPISSLSLSWPLLASANSLSEGLHPFANWLCFCFTEPSAPNCELGVVRCCW
eukprot:1628802-Amphidinium_carterae.1